MRTLPSIASLIAALFLDTRATQAAASFDTLGQPNVASVSQASRCANANARFSFNLSHTVAGFKPQAGGWRTFVALGKPGQPGNATGAKWLVQLDRAAAVLAKFKAAGVPVQFRPLHEQNGDFFWWGHGGRRGVAFSAGQQAWIAMWRPHARHAHPRQPSALGICCLVVLEPRRQAARRSSSGAARCRIRQTTAGGYADRHTVRIVAAAKPSVHRSIRGGIFQDYVRAAPTHHHGRGVGIAGDQVGEDRGIADPQAIEAAHMQAIVNH